MKEISIHKFEQNKGCIPSFENIFKVYYQTMCDFAYGFVKESQSAEDIVQEKFIKFWQCSEDFENLYQVKSWLYTAVRNACVDWNRKTQRDNIKNAGIVYIAQLESEEFKLQQIIRAEVMAEIFSVIDTLPPACHKVFTMFYYEGKNLRRIAEELNLSINTIKSQKAKGLTILREKLPPFSFFLSLFSPW